jgi:mono/diheme cytochrome c family protein
MKRILRRAVWAIPAVLVLIILVVAFSYSGMYNVSALGPDSGPVAWFLSTTSDHSVQRRAATIDTPALGSSDMLRLGFQHYRGMCIGCHGAPGVQIDEAGQGLNPRPPELVETAGEWQPNELFWITKNGIRMTGMPAWGVTHSDDKIWAIVAFLRGLPELTAADYQIMDREIPPLPED